MGSLRSVAVFCGSNVGSNPGYRRAAEELGRALARERIALVYGGGAVGLMGTLADAVLSAGGEVVGVITEALLTKEIAHSGLTELHVLPRMHDRKAMMADRADAFVMMPGGFGTMEEFLEVLTWTQLGVHSKPCAIFDPLGYFAPLVTLMDSAVAEGFIKPEQRELVIEADTPGELLESLAGWRPRLAERWVGRSER